MARRTFVSGASPIARVGKATPGGTIEVGDKFKITVTDEAGVTVTSTTSATGTTVAQTVIDILAQWALETDPRIKAITASNLTTFVQFTATVPFYISVTTTESDNSAADAQTFVYAVTTPGAFPDDFNTAANYAEGIVPVALDDVTFKSGQILYGLQQAAVLTGKMTFDPGFKYAGLPGLPLMMVPSAFTFNASGSTPSYIDTGSANIPLLINGTASPSTGYGLYLTCGNATTVTQNAGSTAIAINAGETSTAATISLISGTLTTGAVTLTSFLQSDGTGTITGVCTNASVDSGTLTTLGTGAITTVTVSGSGIFVGNSTGTITNLKRLGGLSDFMQSRSARAVTNDTYAIGSAIQFDPGVLTITSQAALSTGGSVLLTAKAA